MASYDPPPTEPGFSQHALIWLVVLFFVLVAIRFWMG